jgi:hypothetical protein
MLFTTSALRGSRSNSMAAPQVGIDPPYPAVLLCTIVEPSRAPRRHGQKRFGHLKFAFLKPKQTRAFLDSTVCSTTSMGVKTTSQQGEGRLQGYYSRYPYHRCRQCHQTGKPRKYPWIPRAQQSIEKRMRSRLLPGHWKHRRPTAGKTLRREVGRAYTGVGIGESKGIPIH